MKNNILFKNRKLAVAIVLLPAWMLCIPAMKAQTPTDLQATAVGPRSATLSWTAAGNETSWNLAYLNTGSATAVQTLFSETFDNDSGDWTSIDADGDEYNWGIEDGTASSWSYEPDIGAHEPDNWLVSPAVELRGMLSFDVWSDNNYWSDEHFAVYVSTTAPEAGNFDADTFTEVLPETVSTYDKQTFTIDLEQFEGQTGYVAFRHFNTYDMYGIHLDNVKIVADVWTVVPGVGKPYVLDNLFPEETYKVKVQAGGGGQWSDVVTFTTPNMDLETLTAELTQKYETLQDRYEDLSQILMEKASAGEAPLLYELHRTASTLINYIYIKLRDADDMDDLRDAYFRIAECEAKLDSLEEGINNYNPQHSEEELPYDTWYIIAIGLNGETQTFPMATVGSLVAVDEACDFSILDTDGNVLAEEITKVTFRPSQPSIPTALRPEEKPVNQLSSLVADKLTLVGVSGEVSIYDPHGVKQAQTMADGGETILNISHLPAGIYIVKAGKMSFKFIKK